jgi:hypothetical protein
MKNLFMSIASIGAIEATPTVTEAVTDPNNANLVQVIIQIAIGLVTLFTMLKKKKVETK